MIKQFAKFQGTTKPMPQAGPPANMAQGYGNAVPGAVSAYQQLQQLQASNPRARYESVFNRRNPVGQQFRELERQSRPAVEYAGYLGRNGGGSSQAILSQFGTSGLGQYENRTGEFGDWMARETKRANASGMLSSGFGAMLPGLAMLAIPGAGLAKIATGAAMGGMTGGPVGALTGGIGAAVAPALRMPSVSQAISAPLKAAGSVARQFANPATASRQALAAAVGSWKPRNG